MAKTEATVTSGVKNWYINFFFIGIVGPWEMPIGAKTMKFFSEIKFFRLQGFPGPPRAQERNTKKKLVFLVPRGGGISHPKGHNGAAL